MMPGAVPPHMMGYSDAGDVVEVGPGVADAMPGDRSNVGGPHAQFVVGAHGHIPQELDYESATFIGLTTSAVMWARSTPIEPGDDVVVLGQGIVGNLYMQAVRERSPGRVIAVDAAAMRCRISEESGADVVIDVSETDSVEAVMDLTGGKGADVVVECVGGNAGLKSFEQAQRMMKSDGVLHLIAKYQGAKEAGDGLLPLDSNIFMNKLLIAGMRLSGDRSGHRADAAQMLVDGRVRVGPMVTHRSGLAADRRRLPHATQQARRGLRRDPGVGRIMPARTAAAGPTGHASVHHSLDPWMKPRSARLSAMALACPSGTIP